MRLVVQRAVGIERARLDARLEGARGVLEAAISGLSVNGAAIERAELVVGDGARAALAIERDGDRFALRGKVELDRGRAVVAATRTAAQPLYPARVELQCGATKVTIDLGQVGFRKLELVRDGGAFTVALNGEPLFCRGACWCPLDLAALHVDEARYREALLRVREGGHEHAAPVGRVHLREPTRSTGCATSSACSSGRTSCSPTWTTRSKTRRSWPAASARRVSSSSARAAAVRWP